MHLTVAGQPVCIDTLGQPFDSSLPTLICIHGAQHDHFVWRALAVRLATARRNVLAVDLPDHGASAGPPLPSVEALADWLIALIEKLGAGEAAALSLAGHSMGSLIALEAAARLPDRIRHLFLIGSAVPMPVAPQLLETARTDLPQAMALINRWSHSRLAWRGAQRQAAGHGLWLPAINLRVMERQPPEVLYNDLAACNAYENGPAALTRLTCPTTLIAGREDRMTPLRAARALVAAHPRLRLVEIPGAGHALMAEAPAALYAAIAAGFSPSA